MPYRPSSEGRIEAISKLFQNGKITVPSAVRKTLGVKDGDKIVWINKEGKWIVERA